MNKIEKHILDNGLTIYFYTDKKRHSTFFQHITLFGGKTKDFIVDGKEYHMQDGVAHILEHYVVEENSKGNFLKLLGEAQMSTNASTYFNMTKYYFDAVEDVEFGIRTMIEGIYSPVFSCERLEKIKKPILQEIRGKMDNKFYQANQTTIGNCFSKYKVRSIGGTLEDVSNTTLDDIITCYEAFYQPKNQLIIVGGNFDKESILNVISDCYNKLDIKCRNVELIELNEPNEVSKEKGIIKFPTAENYVEVSFKVNLSNFSVKERLNFDFYLHCFYNMFFGMTSPLYRELVEEKIITTALSCNDFLLDDFNILSVGSYTSKPELLESKIKEAFLKLNYFNEEIFEIDKQNCILRLVLRNESLYDTIMPFVDNVVSFNYPYLDSISDIENLSFNDMVNTLKSIDFSNYTVTIIEK